MADKVFFGTKGIIVKDHKILVLYSDLDNKRFWDFPGGRMIIGEDPRSTYKREVLEETGLRVEPEYLIDTWYYHRNDDFHVAGIFYYTQINDQVVQLSEEHHGYKWLTLEELYEAVDAEVYMRQIKNWKFIKTKSGYDIHVKKR